MLSVAGCYSAYSWNNSVNIQLGLTGRQVWAGSPCCVPEGR